jgi:hypothetical protein
MHLWGIGKRTFILLSTPFLFGNKYTCGEFDESTISLTSAELTLKNQNK